MPQAGGAPDPRRWWALVALATAQLMIVLDATIVNVALPSLQDDLGLADSNRQWVVTAYTLAFGGLLLLGGRIADYMGRKRVFLVGLIGFAVASAVGGAAQTEATLLAARALQGAFGALLAPAALSLLSVTFTESKERARAFGVFGAVAGSGAALGLVLGGVLTEYIDWRWCLFVNLPISALVLLGALVVVRESRREGSTRYDIPGVVLATGGLVALVYGFNRAESDSWTADLTIALLAGGIALLVAFAFVERLVRHPLLPPRVPAERNRAGAYVASTAISIGLIGMTFLLTFYLQQVKGYSPVETGLLFLAIPGAAILSTPLVTRLLTRVRPRYLTGPGMISFAAGLAVLTQLEPDSAYAADVLPGLVLMGTGISFVFSSAINTATYRVDPGDAGAASAMVNATQQVGGSIGTALLSSIAATITADRLPGGRPAPAQLLDATVEGYTVAAAWGAAIIAAAALVVMALTTAGPIEITEPAEAEPSDDGAASEDAPPPPVAPDERRSVTGCVRQGSGAPVGDAAVLLIDRAGRQVARGWTGTDGGFALSAPGAGRHVLVVRASAHQPHASLVDLSHDGRPAQADVVLSGSSGVAGTVRSAVGAAVAGATVTVTDERGNVVASRATGGDGSYEVADLIAGTYTLVVNAEAFQPVARLLIAPEVGLARSDVELAGGARLRGRAIGGLGRRPVPDAHVTLLDENGAVIGVTRTGGDGGFAFFELPQGAYTVVASSYPPSSATIELPAGEQRECEVELDYPEGWRPTVRPVGPDGRGVAGASRAPESGIPKAH